MIMSVDFGKVMLANGQGNGSVAREQGQVGSISCADIRLLANQAGAPAFSETRGRLQEP